VDERHVLMNFIMKVRSRNLIDLLLSGLDFFIHPKILNSGSFILLRSRIIAFWMVMGTPLIISMFFHFHGLVGKWHPMMLTLYYCIFEMVVVVSSLTLFGRYRIALYMLMVSLYLNTPVIVTYSGGLHSPSLVFFLFMPFGVFQLTKSLSLSLLAVLIGVLEVLIIFYLHLSGWDFAGKGIIENYFQQHAGNVLIVTASIWVVTLIYSKSLAQVFLQITDAERFKTVMALSGRLVRGFEKPIHDIEASCELLQSQVLPIESVATSLTEINETIFQLSSMVSDFRLAGTEKKGE